MTVQRGIRRRGVLSGAAMLAGCQAAAPATVVLGPAAAPPFTLDPNGNGYIALVGSLDARRRDFLVRNVNGFLAAGAAGIWLFMASPGGQVPVALDMVRFMDATRREHAVRFTTCNSGILFGTACYVFFAGDRRLSLPRGTLRGQLISTTRPQAPGAP